MYYLSINYLIVSMAAIVFDKVVRSYLNFIRNSEILKE